MSPITPIAPGSSCVPALRISGDDKKVLLRIFVSNEASIISVTLCPKSPGCTGDEVSCASACGHPICGRPVFVRACCLRKWKKLFLRALCWSTEKSAAE